MSKTQAPDPAPRPFTAVKAFADSVLAMLDERIKAADQAAHPFNDYFGDKPETIVAAKAQAGELREVRTQVRILGDRALVELMKFKPAIPAPEGAQAQWNDDRMVELRMLRQRVAMQRYELARLKGPNGKGAPAPQALPATLTDEMRAVLTNEKCVYGSADELYAALLAAAPQTKEPKA